MDLRTKIKTIRYYLSWKLMFGKKRRHYKRKFNALLSPETHQANIKKLKNKISKKIKRKKKITVYFIAYEKAQWAHQSIYNAMKNDPLFDPKVFVCTAWEREGIEKNATQNLIEFFTNKNMEVVTNLDKKNLPDVIFTARYDLKNVKFNVDLSDAYKKILFCYFSYPWIVEGEEKRVYDFYYNPDEIKYFWKEFVPDINSYNAAKSNPVKENVILSGHPKTDEIYAAPETCSYWKGENTKKIIYAPHWSIYNSVYAKGCFERYYINFLNYLKNHPEVEIVLKPHPMLRKLISDKKLRKDWNVESCITLEEYDNFINEWKNLPNGNIMDNGDYFSLFKSSDAMILDSLSFTAEYMIVNKPMCWCSRQNNEVKFRYYFNRMGNELLDAIDIAFNWEQIEKFIEKIAQGKDENQEKRQAVIRKHLEINKGHVGEFIKDNIKKDLLG